MKIKYLSGKKLFAEIFSRGVRGSSRHLRVRMLLNPVTEARVAAITPKHIGSAVLRNRIRRRLRAAFAEIFPKLPAADIAVIATAKTSTLPYTKLVTELSRAIDQTWERLQ